MHETPSLGLVEGSEYEYVCVWGMPCPSAHLSQNIFSFRTLCSGGVSDEAACMHCLPQPMVMGWSVSAVSANLAALCNTVYENIFYLPPPPPSILVCCCSRQLPNMTTKFSFCQRQAILVTGTTALESKLLGVFTPSQPVRL